MNRIPPSKSSASPRRRAASATGHPDPRGALARDRAGGAGGDLHEVYFRLRQSILSGGLAPGEVVNQVHVARQFNVSRTPVREALRILQAEGLVEAQFQHRMRVTAVNADEVDAAYAMWILLQTLAIALAVPRITDAEIAQLRELLLSMNERSPRRTGKPADWEPVHQEFHRLLVAHAGPVIVAAIDSCWARSERARRTHLRASPQSWRESELEHRDVVEAYAQRSVARAVEVMSRQLTRVALAVIRSLDPDHGAPAIRQALALATQPDGRALASALSGLLAAPARQAEALALRAGR